MVKVTYLPHIPRGVHHIDKTSWSAAEMPIQRNRPQGNDIARYRTGQTLNGKKIRCLTFVGVGKKDGKEGRLT